MDRAERPFRDFAQFINRERAAYGKGSVFELLAKEAGNSASMASSVRASAR